MLRIKLLFLLITSFFLNTSPIYGQADPSRSLRPLNVSQSASEGASFIYINWIPPVVIGRPEINVSTITATHNGTCSESGNIYTVEFTFIDPENNMQSGNVRLLHRPSLFGANAQLMDNSFSASSDSEGLVNFDVCINFELDNDITLEIAIISGMGKESTFSSITIVKGTNFTSSNYANGLINKASFSSQNIITSALENYYNPSTAYVEFVFEITTQRGFDSIRLGVGDPSAPTWEVTREVIAENSNIHYAEIDISEAEQFLPPSEENPWYVKSNEVAVISAFSITDSNGNSYFASDLPIAVSPDPTETVFINNPFPDIPNLIGYRIYSEPTYAHEEIIDGYEPYFSSFPVDGDTLPPYVTSYTFLDWVWDGIPDDENVFRIAAIYDSFNSFSAPAFPFFNITNPREPLFDLDEFQTNGGARGASWGDLNNDNRLDLFIPRFKRSNLVFIRDPFYKQVVNFDDTVTETYSGSFGDYDNDGDLDLVVANYKSSSIVYQNQFSETGIVSFLNKFEFGPRLSTTGVSFVDYDLDGKLDIHFTTQELPDVLLRNEGDNDFNEINGPWSGLRDQSMSGIWGDYDNDGDQDLFVVTADIDSPNRLYKNNLFESGSATFELMSNVGVDEIGRSVSASWGDYDNDGDLDLLVANDNTGSYHIMLYKNLHVEGELGFQRIHEEQSSHPLFGIGGESYSSSWADFDNDGDLDLFSTVDNEGGNSLGGIRPLMFINTNGESSSEILFCEDNQSDLEFCKPRRDNSTRYESGLRGMAWADTDGDGFQDLFIPDADKSSSLNLFNQYPYVSNSDQTNHWIKLKLVGAGESINTTAIGARATVYTSPTGAVQSQIAEITGASGAGSQNSPYLTFGIGATTVVDSISIRWPTYPEIPNTVLRNVNVDTFLVVNAPNIDNPIPVELTSFEVYRSDEFVHLHWKTASELNNAGFEIERSEDALSFAKIGYVEGYGTTNEPQTYFFEDNLVPNNTDEVYYRLKQIDFDGQFEYSEVQKLQLALPTQAKLFDNYPNPFNPSTSIRYDLPLAGHVKITIYDATGKEVATLKNDYQEAGRHEIHFDARTLASGSYFYRLQSRNVDIVKSMSILK